MIKTLLLVLLLAIYHSILFYEKKLGLSVILFIIPLLIIICKILKNEEKVKDKKGFLFIIPITLLSMTYLFFNSLFFQITNLFIIPILFILMYIYTIKPTFKLPILLKNIFQLIFEPFKYFSNIYHLIIENIKLRVKISNNLKKILKSVLLILPIILIILVLLSTADQIFGTIFEKIFNNLKDLSLPRLIKETISRIIPIIFIFFYISSTINYLLYNYSKKENNDIKINLKVESLTIKLLLTILNIIYIVFDIIQIKSLILHQVSTNINYAEYARQGFFQLMLVSFINLIIILISKKVEEKQSKGTIKYIRTMNLLMILLTFIIILSAFIRMYMYECEFGYTLLRLLVYISLASEVILLIPTIIYILKSKFNIVKAYMVILIIIYTVINFINIDYLIASKNIERYYKKEKLDLFYLENGKTDNIPVLVELYNKTGDKELKNEIKLYLESLDIKINGIQEYNLSKSIAIEKINQLKIISE